MLLLLCIYVYDGNLAFCYNLVVTKERNVLSFRFCRYPLAFVGVREGLLDLFQVKKRSNKILNALTVVTLTAITSLALKVKDVSFVLAFAGATLGNALIYVFPSIMFRGTVNKMTNASPKLKRESKLALMTASLGVIFGCIGANMALKSLG